MCLHELQAYSVVCIQNNEPTVCTRRENKISVTGWSRTSL